jgi:cell division topological specificity factor
MGFLDRLFGRSPQSSSDIAKERLQVVLTSDRTNISPALLEVLKDDIIRSISDHVEIDRSGIQITVSKGRGFHRVVADIPVIRAREAAPAPPRQSSSRRNRRSSPPQPAE